MDCHRRILLICVLFQVFSCPGFASAIAGINQDAEQDAEELFHQAVTSLNRARNEAEDYTSTLVLYKKAREKVDVILNEYASTSLAVELVSGQQRISGFSLERFLQRGQFLEILSAAENDPMSCTLVLSGRITDPAERSNGTSNLPDAFSRVKLFNEALSWGSRNPKILIRQAKHLADIGEREKASRLIFQALEAQGKSKGIGFLKDIAENYSLAGEKKKVRELLILLREAVMGRPELTEDSRERYLVEPALGDISGAYAESGFFVEALDLAGFIEDKGDRSRAIIKIAEEYFVDGETIKAAELLEQAKSLSESLDADDDWKKPWVLRTLAVSYAKTGRFSEALATVELFERDSDKYSILSRIAGEYFRVGKRDEAIRLQNEAVEIVETHYKTESGKNDAAIGIAKIYVENGFYKEALEVTESLCNAKGKTQIYPQIAEAYFRSGKTAEAVQYLKSSIISLGRMRETPWSTIWALERIVNIVVEAGSKELFPYLFEVAEKMEDPRVKAEFLGRIAEAYAELGELEESSKIFSLALRTVGKIGGEFEMHGKCDALAEIGAGYHIAGLQLKDEDKAVLRELVLKAYPLESFWDWGMHNIVFRIWYMGLFPPR
jgi:tetratricopeptide (TPR) repeat protein